MRGRISLGRWIVVAASYPIFAEAAEVQVDPSPSTALMIDVENPPRVGRMAAQVPDGQWLNFTDGTQVIALPSVIFTVDEGAQIPAGAEPLGPGGRSWRVRSASVAHAVEEAAALQSQPGVRTALPDLWLPRQATAFDDPGYGGQWYLDFLEMPALYDVSLGDPDVRIAVIDSAIDLDHPDLAGGWAAPKVTFGDDDDPRPNPGEFCNGGSGICDDHGTAVSGIIAARANNGVDLVGICPECTLIPIKLLGEGGGTLGRDIAAFEHAIAADAAVINNSWGYVDAIPVPTPLADVIHRAATETRGGLGSLVIFAAGNDDRSIGDDELQALDDVLCVTATDRYGLPTAYTNKGASVDVAAPSATVSLAAGGGTLETFGGTSAAAPVVAGLAGWALSVDPSLSAEDLRNLLVDTAIPSPLVTHDASGHHTTYGFGEVSPANILAALTPDEPPPAKGCGCQASPASWAAFGPWAWLALVCLRRRR
ncbi:MAG: S8 family serine peptidase [Myxococcota bacterium]